MLSLFLALIAGVISIASIIGFKREQLTAYIDGLVAAVPTAHREKYKAHEYGTPDQVAGMPPVTRARIPTGPLPAFRGRRRHLRRTRAG